MVKTIEFLSLGLEQLPRHDRRKKYDTGPVANTRYSIACCRA